MLDSSRYRGSAFHVSRLTINVDLPVCGRSDLRFYSIAMGGTYLLLHDEYQLGIGLSLST